MKKSFITFAGIVMLFTMNSPAVAGNDPSIKGKVREGVKMSMQKFIQDNTKEERFVIYDSVSGKLLNLTLDELHSGVVKKGDFFVSCADFHDSENTLYDIDFLVSKDGSTYKTLEAVVHSANGDKRKYHIEK